MTIESQEFQDKILKLLEKEPLWVQELARRLKTYPTKVQYNVGVLAKTGRIKINKQYSGKKKRPYLITYEVVKNV